MPWQQKIADLLFSAINTPSYSEEFLFSVCLFICLLPTVKLKHENAIHLTFFSIMAKNRKQLKDGLLVSPFHLPLLFIAVRVRLLRK